MPSCFNTRRRTLRLMRTVRCAERTAVVLGAVGSALMTGGIAWAQATWVTTYSNAGTGITDKGTAVFTVPVAGELDILISNTTAVAIGRGDVLSGVFFNLTGTITAVPTDGASNISTVLPSGSVAFDSKTGTTTATGLSSSAINDSYVFGKQTNNGTTIVNSQYQYGVNSSGYSNSAGTTKYSFSGFGMGNGGDDYALVSSSTLTINGNSDTLVRNQVLVKVTGFTGLTAPSQVTNVAFAFASGAGTSNAYDIGTGQLAVPEPVSTALLLPVALGALLPAFRGRKRNR